VASTNRPHHGRPCLANKRITVTFSRSNKVDEAGQPGLSITRCREAGGPARDRMANSPWRRNS